MKIELTHSKLCEIAQSWLLRNNGGKCNISYKEVGSMYSGERADAWGYKLTGGYSVLVEAKTSRSDFLADFKKPHRNGEVLGMGNFRYYICPTDLIKESELPKGWGLIYVNKFGHCKLIAGVHKDVKYINTSLDNCGNWVHTSNREVELGLTSHLLSRLGDTEKLNTTFRVLHSQVNRLERENQKYKQRSFLANV